MSTSTLSADRTRPPGALAESVRVALRQLRRNRLAAALLLVFVPLWYLVLGQLAGDGELPYRVRSVDMQVTAGLRELLYLTAGLSALIMIVGFTAFVATRRALALDRRLVRCGMSPAPLIGAKLLAVVVAACVVGLYAFVVLLAYWRMDQPAAVLAGFVLAAVEYGALGVLLGVVLPGDLEGLFVVVMLGLVDTFLQNPLGNPMAEEATVAWFPAYGPMQVAAGGAFAHEVSGATVLTGMAWAVGFSVLAGLGLWARTRRR